jgi:hypothetical protein
VQDLALVLGRADALKLAGQLVPRDSPESLIRAIDSAASGDEAVTTRRTSEACRILMINVRSLPDPND